MLLDGYYRVSRQYHAALEIPLQTWRGQREHAFPCCGVAHTRRFLCYFQGGFAMDVDLLCSKLVAQAERLYADNRKR